MCDIKVFALIHCTVRVQPVTYIKVVILLHFTNFRRNSETRPNYMRTLFYPPHVVIHFEPSKQLSFICVLTLIVEVTYLHLNANKVLSVVYTNTF